MRLAALLFLLPMLTSAQEIKPEDLCTVEGQILNAATEAPVKKATVVLMRTDVSPGPGGMPPSYSATTDAAGKFAMKAIEPGKYRLSVTRNGFVNMTYGARSPARPGTTLSLERGQILKNVDMHLTPHGIITGRILDEDGEPIPYVTVGMMRFQYQEGRKQLTSAGGGSTNDLGEYRIFGIAPGKYYVSATARSAAMMAPSLVADRSPQPEEDYLSTYYPGVVDPANAAQVEVGPGATVSGINLTLSKSRTVHVKGHVTNTVLPGRRISVMMMPRTNSPFMGGMRNNQVDAKGNFDIRGVTPGAYSIFATLNEDGKSYTAKAPLEVGSNNIENVGLVLAAGADIAGAVRVEGESTQDLSNGNVFVRLQPREVGGMFMGASAARLKPDRSFVLQGAGADTFNVMVSGLPDGFYLKAIKSGEVDVLAMGLDVPKAAAQSLEIVLSPNAGEVKGTVQNSKTSQPAPGATVVLVPQEKDRREQSTYYRMITADQHGNYTFKSVPPGDYKAFAWEDVEYGAYMDPEFMKPVEEKGEAVTVRESDRKSVTLTMIANEPRA